MKRIMALTLASTLSVAGQEALAIAFTLDFEGVGDNAQILDFYNGGTDSQGNSGEDYGIQFGENALALVDRDAGGNGNFANEPTPDTAMYFLAGSSILNYEPGFESGFSFFYTTRYAATVTVWDDVNASGNLLGTLDLFINNLANGCVGDPQGGPGDPYGQFCNFDSTYLAFDGIAKSIDFSGTANQVGFDNITFGSIDPSGSGYIPDDEPEEVVNPIEPTNPVTPVDPPAPEEPEVVVAPPAPPAPTEPPIDPYVPPVAPPAPSDPGGYQPIPTSVVPLPAPALMLILGLMGLAGASRRIKRK